MAIKKETTEVRKEQIIKAAFNIIGDDGIQGLTTARIAGVVGVSEAGLYRHFKNKDAILTAVVEDLDDKISDNLRKVISEPVSPVSKLEMIFQRHLALIKENRGIPRLVFSSELHFRKDLRERLSSLIAGYLKGLADIIRSGIREGSINSRLDADAMAGMLVGMIQLTALRWSLSDFKSPLLKEGDKLWQEYKKSVMRCEQ